LTKKYVSAEKNVLTKQFAKRHSCKSNFQKKKKKNVEGRKINIKMGQNLKMRHYVFVTKYFLTTRNILLQDKILTRDIL